MKKILAILTIGAIAMMTSCGGGGGGGGTPTETANSKSLTLGAQTVTVKGDFTDAEWTTTIRQAITDAYDESTGPGKMDIQDAIGGGFIIIDNTSSYTWKTVSSEAKTLHLGKGKLSTLTGAQFVAGANAVGTTAQE